MPRFLWFLLRLVDHVFFRISEYRKFGFAVKGIVGIDRSPSFGGRTTSRDNRETSGEGVFIAALHQVLEKRGITIEIRGVKAFEPENAVKTLESLLESRP